MGKIAFVFPGQGAQYTGMAKDFWEQIPASRRVFDIAREVSGIDMEELMFTENEQLNITEYTQIAMLTAELAILEAVKEQGLSADVMAGLSLGEYGALAASGVLSMRDALAVVRKRGIYMQEAVPEGGAMAAVLGLDAETVASVCEAAEGCVSVANYNCPGQIVITGEAAAVENACEQLKSAGAKRTLPLKVSGPFHSSMLAGAGEKLGAVLEPMILGDIEIPYVTNVTADYVTDKSQVKELLKLQVSSPVKWQQSMERMLADGVDTFVEIGPGRTLSGFMKKIDRNAKAINIEKLEDLEKIRELQ